MAVVLQLDFVGIRGFVRACEFLLQSLYPAVQGELDGGHRFVAVGQFLFFDRDLMLEVRHLFGQ